jgi:L-fuculose-phosphate aldolase
MTPMQSPYQVKKSILEVGRSLYERSFVVATDGNISVRVSDDRIWATPSGLCKGMLSDEQLVLCDMEGKRVSGSLKPSSEIGMHIMLYRERPDIRAVVHAHPPTATGFAVAGLPLTPCVLPEVVITLGQIPLAPYGTPGTHEISDPIRQYVKDHDAFLLQNHGATTVGSDLLDAYFKMETLEHFARIVLVAHQLGGVGALGSAEVQKLMGIRERLGIRGEFPVCDTKEMLKKGSPGCATCSGGTGAEGRKAESESDLVQAVIRRVMAELKKG